jgi:hypothetical protein
VNVYTENLLTLEPSNRLCESAAYSHSILVTGRTVTRNGMLYIVSGVYCSLQLALTTVILSASCDEQTDVTVRLELKK